MWIDSDFPKVLGAELYRQHPAYVAELAIEPTIVHDYSKAPGETVQLDRYNYWGQPGTKESRERTADQTIGTASSRNITKQKILCTLKEYSGPADPQNPSAPSTFKVSRQNLMTAQRLLLDQGSLGIFHQSIGSLTLLDDYRRWRDRVFLNELYKCYSRGKADGERGGYYFPQGLTEAELATPGYNVTTAGDNDRGKFSVKEDWLTVVTDMRTRNIPTFNNGYYRVLADPVFCKHLRQDSDYREVARYPGSGMINPMMPMMQPNASNYMGFGPAYGQAGFVGGAPTMPTGTLWEGCQIFETTNMAEYTYNVAIQGAKGFTGNTAKQTRAAVGFFFGPQCIGLGIGGQNAQILINSNDDFSRFVILIWQLMAGWEVLNYDFCTIAHSFVYNV